MTFRSAFIPAAALLLGLVIVAGAGAESRAESTADATAEPGPAGEALIWQTDLAAAVEQAKKQNTYLVVNLYAEWCGWCRKLESEEFPTSEFRDFAKDKVLLRVDVEDGDVGSRLQAQHSAYSLPTTLVLDADLVQVGKVMGFAPASSLVPRFEAEIAAWQRLVSRFPQILAAGSDSLRRTLAQELHERSDGSRAAQLYAKVIEAAGAQALDAPWLFYRMADAHRLAREFAQAEAATLRARQLSEGHAAAAGLKEQLDLLDYQIAQDAGDCQGAKTTLQRYLDRNPGSKAHRKLARQLQQLEQGHGHTICA